jgi:hypothetical protein
MRLQIGDLSGHSLRPTTLIVQLLLFEPLKQQLGFPGARKTYLLWRSMARVDSNCAGYPSGKRQTLPLWGGGLGRSHRSPRKVLCTAARVLGVTQKLKRL